MHTRSKWLDSSSFSACKCIAEGAFACLILALLQLCCYCNSRSSA